MKALATGAFVLAALTYAACQVIARNDGLDGGPHGALGYLNAAAEAAMVGALADWFAVTALFRHPLRIPVPHTAIIPRRKDALGRSLQEFVAGNFLTEPVVREQIARARVSARVGAWLGRPENAERVAAEVAAAARGLLRVMRDEDVTAVVEQVVVRQLAARSWSPPAGRLLGRIVTERAHHRLVDLVVDHVHAWLSANPERVHRLVTDQAPTWSPAWLDHRVAEHVYHVVMRFTDEVRGDPEHRLRRTVDEALAKLGDDLQNDPATRERFDRITAGLLARHDVRDAVATLWTALRQVLIEAIDDPGSELRVRAAAGLADYGRRLAADERLAARIDAYVQDAAGHLAANYSQELATVISDTVQRWDGEEASRLIEQHVGRDLQFIRINGTVVGGLAGLAIHAVTRLAG
jgi:uncharacterized membrane-anchored protein YjiN (DUF445 family)